jgi:hypothetical protein
MLTRKQFLRSALPVCAGALGLTLLHACSSSSPTPGPDASPQPNNQGNCLANGTRVTIGANHGHVLVVTKDDVAARAAKTYHIQGMSDHDHTVMLTASELDQLAAGSAIMTESSVDLGHSHSIMVACA